MKIVLSVCGSIAAYKTFDLTRDLVKKGHEVRVVLTRGALKFVKPEVFRYLGAQEVFLHTSDFTQSTPGVPHVDLGKWADTLIFVPLSANTLSQLTRGSAVDFATSLFLAWPTTKPVLFFPAMNTNMWDHPFTQDNLTKLKSLSHVHIHGTKTGVLVCGDVGAGKLMDVEAISTLIECHNPLKKQKRKILITTGATVSPLDPVRYLTNPSSGITGYYLAKKYLTEGFEVTLITGHAPHLFLEHLSHHPQCHYFRAPTTEEMKTICLNQGPSADLIIASAAVADIEFKQTKMKLKKEQLKDLPFVQAVDILKLLLEKKKKHQKIVSFSAETEALESLWREKFNRKPTDLMIGNVVHSGLDSEHALQGFAQNEGQYYFITQNKTQDIGKLTKAELANKLLEWDQQGQWT